MGNRGHSTDVASESDRVGEEEDGKFAHRFRRLSSPPDLVPLVHLAVEHGSGDPVLDQSVHRVRAVQLVFFDKITRKGRWKKRENSSVGGVVWVGESVRQCEQKRERLLSPWRALVNTAPMCPRGEDKLSNTSTKSTAGWTQLINVLSGWTQSLDGVICEDISGVIPGSPKWIYSYIVARTVYTTDNVVVVPQVQEIARRRRHRRQGLSQNDHAFGGRHGQKRKLRIRARSTTCSADCAVGGTRCLKDKTCAITFCGNRA